MISLAVNYFPELIELAAGRDVHFDCVKTGDWVVESIDRAMQEFAERTILFHTSCIVGHTDAECRWLATQVQLWQSRVGSPWVSSHLDYYTAGEREARLLHDAPLPRISEQEGLDRLCRAAEAVQQLVPVPLILENVPNRWENGRLLGATPEFVRKVLSATGCGLLLDLAHARISAEVLHVDVHDYLVSLPLDLVVEIHVSGPRKEQGFLRDRHDRLAREDYRLLEWVLRRCSPRAITLEYWKDVGQAGVQLRRLRRIIEAASRLSVRRA